MPYAFMSHWVTGHRTKFMRKSTSIGNSSNSEGYRNSLWIYGKVFFRYDKIYHPVCWGMDSLFRTPITVLVSLYTNGLIGECHRFA